MSLEKKLFSFLVIFGINMSIISIIIDLKVGLPTSVNSIWVILVIVFLLAYIIDRRYEYSKIGVRIVGIFSVFVLLPYSFVKFGGSSTTLLCIFNGCQYMVLIQWKRKKVLYINSSINMHRTYFNRTFLSKDF